MTDGPVDTLLERAQSADFREWYRERRRRENARAGKFAYNGPRDPPSPDLHTPSSLVQCHRKRRYEEANAPAEDPSPNGHFWIGSTVETDLVHPFLEDRVAGPEQYVTEGLGFQTEIEGPEGTFRLRGRTDPVITTETGEPLLPTEVKTVEDIERVTEPRVRHRAQVHAYLVALSERVEDRLEEALLLYVSKSTLACRALRVSFDEGFWTELVLPWMATLTAARAAGELPPPVPEQDWECGFCRFRRRCGQADGPVADAGPEGFVPSFTYPRAAVRTHLAATGVALTPTLARAYPDLAAETRVSDWVCPACGHRADFGTFDWSGPGQERPACPACAADGDHVPMRGPLPATGWY